MSNFRLVTARPTVVAVLLVMLAAVWAVAFQRPAAAHHRPDHNSGKPTPSPTASESPAPDPSPSPSPMQDPDEHDEMACVAAGVREARCTLRSTGNPITIHVDATVNPYYCIGTCLGMPWLASATGYVGPAGGELAPVCSSGGSLATGTSCTGTWIPHVGVGDLVECLGSSSGTLGITVTCTA